MKKYISCDAARCLTGEGVCNMFKSGDIVRNIPNCFERCKFFPALSGIFLSLLAALPRHHLPIEQLVGDAVEDAGGFAEAGDAVEDTG